MSHRRLRRFLHLERPRTPGAPDAPSEPGHAAGRIDAVQRPGGAGPPAPARTGARLDRFGPEPEPVIELAETAGRLPFSRCLGCGQDAHALATTCPGCGARLDTPEQRAHDERLWAELQQASAREAAAAQALRAARAREDDEATRARRALAEAMAREIGARERRRLDGGLDWGERWRPRDATPLGLRLLRALPPGWRVPAAVTAAVTVLGLALAGLAGGARGPRGLLVMIAAAVVVLLVTPRGDLRRWW